MDIYRPQTEAEKDIRGGGFKDIRNWRQTDIKQIESKKISEISQNCIYKKREPYCLKCAHAILNEKIEEVEKRIKNTIMNKETDVKIDFNIDYEKFGGKRNFDLISIEDINEMQIISGMKQSVVTKEYHNYRCKKCGGNISLQFNKSELNDNAKKSENPKNTLS